MSKVADFLLEKTSKPAAQPALLVLEDGTCFPGPARVALGSACGEISFNSSLEG